MMTFIELCYFCIATGAGGSGFDTGLVKSDTGQEVLDSFFGAVLSRLQAAEMYLTPGYTLRRNTASRPITKI